MTLSGRPTIFVGPNIYIRGSADERSTANMSQVTGYDITIASHHFATWQDLAKVLTEWGSKWAFQLEKGAETGYMHWQIRLRLIKKKRANELKGENKALPGHWSVTSNAVHADNSFNYVMKADTRVEGPWDDRTWAEQPIETRQLRSFMDKPLRDWQKVLLARIQQEDDRKIIMVHDDVGNSGKSIFAEFLEYKKLALELPPLRNMEDLMQFAFGFKDQKCYLVDMPRAIKKDKLSDFYSGIECLKNGVVWDKRYAAKKRRMDRPQIVVFTNITPKWEFMSADRWEVYSMQADHSMLLREVN